MGAPLIGRKVKIEGLASRPELNGTSGIAVSFDDGKGRYNVKLESSGDFMALKPANVTAADSGGDSGGGGGGFPGGFGGGGMPGGFGGMPGMGGGGGGAQAAMLQMMLQQLKERLNLPPGVTPQHLGIGLVISIFVTPRVLGIGTMQSLLLGGAGGFVYVSAQSSEKGGLAGIRETGQKVVSQIGQLVSRASGQPVSDRQAGVFLIGILFLLWKFVLAPSTPSGGGGGLGSSGLGGGSGGFGSFFGGGGGTSRQDAQGYAAYSKGYRDGQQGKPYDPIADLPDPVATKSSSGGGFGLSSMFSLMMVGSMVMQMGGRPFNLQTLMHNVRNANPMQLIMMVSMLSSLFS